MRHDSPTYQAIARASQVIPRNTSWMLHMHQGRIDEMRPEQSILSKDKQRYQYQVSKLWDGGLSIRSLR